MITLTVVDHKNGRHTERKLRYKTLGGARRGAHRIVTAAPRFDSDGYAVSPNSGKCLFVQGAALFELFDNAPRPLKFKKGHGP